MKKSIWFILLIAFFASCEGPSGPMGPQGLPGRDGQNGKDGEGVSWFVKNTSISWDMWSEEQDATGPYLYYEIREPRLTKDVLNTAILETYYCYRLEQDDPDFVRYVPLSYSDFWSNKEEYFTVEYSIGIITIIYKNSTGEEGPEFDTYDFQARAMW